MPYIFVIVGLILFISGMRGTHEDLFALLKRDFTGPQSFVVWILAIGIVGGLGYIRPLRPIANAFLVLLIIVLFLSNGGFFSKLQNQLGLKI